MTAITNPAATGIPVAGGGGNAEQGIVTLLDLGDSSGSIVLDLSLAHAFKINLTDDATISFTDWADGTLQEQLTLLVQSNGYAITWDSVVLWNGTAPPVLAAHSGNLFCFRSMDNGTTVIGNVEAIRFLPVPGYRYLRFYSIAGPTDFFQIAEFEIATSEAGPNILTSSSPAFASASASGWPPSNMLDGNTSTAWSTPGAVNMSSPGNWVSFDMGDVGTVPYEIRVLVYNDGAGTRIPNDFEVQGSNDESFSSYSVIASFSGVTSTQWASGKQTFVLQ